MNVLQKVSSNNSSPLLRSNINVQRGGGGDAGSAGVVRNFSHPLADLCPTSPTEPLINLGSMTQVNDDQTTDLLQLSSQEVIRHHVMRKRILTATSENRTLDSGGDSDGGVPRNSLKNNTKDIVIYSTTAVDEMVAATSPSPMTESLTATATPTVIGDFNSDEGEQEDKLGLLQPTLNSILRNDDTGCDLFDVKSNLDDFYVKQLNYENYQLQLQKQQLLIQSRKLFHSDHFGAKNYYSSLPRTRMPYASRKDLMGFSTDEISRGEDLFDAPLEESLFRSSAKLKSNSELDLMTSVDASSLGSLPNGLSFISPMSIDTGVRERDLLGDNGRLSGAIINPLSDNNRTTPLLNFAATTAQLTATGSGNGTKSSTVDLNGANISSSGGGGIFPSNCGSPSIVMNASSTAPLATSSILSPTNVSVPSSSSPSSSASSSMAGNGLSKRSYTTGLTKGGDYDYHAAQLEMFLDEYKRLQHQLCKMKETCDSIRRTEQLFGSYGSGVGGGGDLAGVGPCNKTNMPSTISSAFGGGAHNPHYSMNSKLLDKSNVLMTGAEPIRTLPKKLLLGNKHKSYSGTTPEPPPYWLHRNELLKGIQQTQQQQRALKAQQTQILGHSLGKTQHQYRGMDLDKTEGSSNTSRTRIMESNANSYPESGSGESSSSGGSSS